MDPRFKTLTMRHLLTGLIHNLNTPLNLILGYAQQLQRAYPDETGLQKIIDAGLRIDHQLNNANGALQVRLFQNTQNFDPEVWLRRELSFLSCDLKIKRGIVFDCVSVSAGISVNNSEQLLSLVFETVIYSILESKTEASARIGLSLASEPDAIILGISFPQATIGYTGDLIRIVNAHLDPLIESWDIPDWQNFLNLVPGTDNGQLLIIIKRIDDR